MSDPNNPYGGYVPPSGNPYGEPPPASQPFGQPPQGQPPQGQPYGQPYGQPQPGAYHPAYAPTPQGPGRRPGTVTAAAVLTWVGSTIALLGLAFLMVAVLADVDEYYEGFEESASGWSRDEISAFTTIFAVIGIVWCLAAMVLAFFVVRRRNWARIMLTVSAAVAIPLCLLTALAVLPLLNLILCIATIVLLYIGRANPWFKA